LLLKEQYEYAVVAYDCCRGLLESNGHRGTQSDFTVSSSNAHEVGIESRASAGKAKLGAIRKFIDTSKFRNSLKKRRSASLNRVKNLSLPIVDVRDAKDQQAVEELRRELLARDLLPPQHDDYHVLSWHIDSHYLQMQIPFDRTLWVEGFASHANAKKCARDRCYWPSGGGYSL
jgi:hypothetical protein